jgi:hypothetical protein
MWPGGTFVPGRMTGRSRPQLKFFFCISITGNLSPAQDIFFSPA